MKNQSVSDLSAKHLRRAANLKDKIEALQVELSRVLGGSDTVKSSSPVKRKKGGMSPAGRARVSAALKKRWAKVRKDKKAKAREEQAAA